MNKIQRTGSREGIYSVYWKVEEDKGGYKSVQLLAPDQKQAPNTVKIMLVDALLKDLNIPIRIENHLIPEDIK